MLSSIIFLRRFTRSIGIRFICSSSYSSTMLSVICILSSVMESKAFPDNAMRTRNSSVSSAKATERTIASFQAYASERALVSCCSFHFRNVLPGTPQALKNSASMLYSSLRPQRDSSNSNSFFWASIFFVIFSKNRALNFFFKSDLLIFCPIPARIALWNSLSYYYYSFSIIHFVLLTNVPSAPK